MNLPFLLPAIAPAHLALARLPGRRNHVRLLAALLSDDPSWQAATWLALLLPLGAIAKGFLGR